MDFQAFPNSCFTSCLERNAGQYCCTLQHSASSLAQNYLGQQEAILLSQALLNTLLEHSIRHSIRTTSWTGYLLLTIFGGEEERKPSFNKNVRKSGCKGFAGLCSSRIFCRRGRNVCTAGRLAQLEAQCLVRSRGTARETQVLTRSKEVGHILSSTVFGITHPAKAQAQLMGNTWNDCTLLGC